MLVLRGLSGILVLVDFWGKGEGKVGDYSSWRVI